MALPERHLGLVQAGEHPRTRATIDQLAAMAEQHFDLDGIMASAVPFRPAARTATAVPLPPPGQRIALARDQAFSFVYPHLIEAGAAPARKFIAVLTASR